MSDKAELQRACGMAFDYGRYVEETTWQLVAMDAALHGDVVVSPSLRLPLRVTSWRQEGLPYGRVEHSIEVMLTGCIPKAMFELFRQGIPFHLVPMPSEQRR